jgi:ferredoxin-NADP reductase
MSAEFEKSVVVASLTAEAQDVVCVELRLSDGGALPAWSPGAHIDLLLPNGIERQYSLCGEANDNSVWRVAVLREQNSRGGSAYIHGSLAIGDTVTARGPRNHFPLMAGSEHRMIAGGIGVTPLIPMVAELEAAGAPWQMLYGGRQRASMAFLAPLAQFGEKVVVRPQDEFGLLDLPTFLADMADGARVYVCGPEQLLEAVEALAAPWADGILNVERFHPRAGALDGVNTSFTVVLEQSNAELEVPPDKSIVEVLREHGLDVPTSCEEGTCGTCETFVLDGVPDHRDSVLTDAEHETNEIMMICCGRSKTPVLVLDL